MTDTTAQHELLAQLAEATTKAIVAEYEKAHSTVDPLLIDAFCSVFFDQLRCIPPDLWGRGISISFPDALRQKMTDAELRATVASLSEQVQRQLQPLTGALLLQLARCSWAREVERATRVATENASEKPASETP